MLPQPQRTIYLRRLDRRLAALNQQPPRDFPQRLRNMPDEKAWLESADKACYQAKKERRGKLVSV
jgi:hypothetical protein